MKKRLLIILLGGALLATLSIAVPVAIVPLLQRSPEAAATAYRLPQSPPHYPDPDVVWVYWSPGLVREKSSCGIGINDSWHVSRWRAGWPITMLEGSDYCEIHAKDGQPASGTVHQQHLKVWYGDYYRRAWTLPTRPTWSGAGLLLNWFVWSAAIGFLFVPRVARHAMRRRRGRCINCGYPRSVNKVCPECGHATA